MMALTLHRRMHETRPAVMKVWVSRYCPCPCSCPSSSKESGHPLENPQLCAITAGPLHLGSSSPSWPACKTHAYCLVHRPWMGPILTSQKPLAEQVNYSLKRGASSSSDSGSEASSEPDLEAAGRGDDTGSPQSPTSPGTVPRSDGQTTPQSAGQKRERDAVQSPDTGADPAPKKRRCELPSGTTCVELDPCTLIPGSLETQNTHASAVLAELPRV